MFSWGVLLRSRHILVYILLPSRGEILHASATVWLSSILRLSQKVQCLYDASYIDRDVSSNRQHATEQCLAKCPIQMSRHSHNHHTFCYYIIMNIHYIIVPYSTCTPSINRAAFSQPLFNLSWLTVSTPTTLKYFCMYHGDQRVFSIWNHHKCFSWLFPLYSNTYVMGLLLLYLLFFFRARIDFRRHNLTSLDFRFCPLK